jgi:hypothetical protein
MSRWGSRAAPRSSSTTRTTAAAGRSCRSRLPLDGNSWERQERELLAGGHRVSSYDPLPGHLRLRPRPEGGCWAQSHRSLLKTDDNTDGVDRQVFEGIKAGSSRTATPTSRTSSTTSQPALWLASSSSAFLRLPFACRLTRLRRAGDRVNADVDANLPAAAAFVDGHRRAPQLTLSQRTVSQGRQSKKARKCL